MAIAPPQPRSKGKPQSNESPLYVPAKPISPEMLEWIKQRERRRDADPLPDTSRSRRDK